MSFWDAFKRKEPDATLHEQLRLIIKAARRCAHDLEHAADDVHWTRDRADRSNMWHERAHMWQAIFYPDAGPKDYRDRLHHEIWKLENEVSRLRSLLAQNNVKDDMDQSIPF